MQTAQERIDVELELNTSGIEPAGYAVLVRPYEPQIKEQGVIAIPDTVRERHEMLEARAIVIAVGPAAWQDEAQPRAKPGDRVLITKYAGAMLIGPWDKKQYRMINDRDIYALIVKERAHGN